MNTEPLRDLWHYINLCFVVNYSLHLLGLFVAFPLPCLPSFFNSLFLLEAYSPASQGFVSKFKAYVVNTLGEKIFTHPNTFCTFLLHKHCSKHSSLPFLSLMNIPCCFFRSCTKGSIPQVLLLQHRSLSKSEYSCDWKKCALP